MRILASFLIGVLWTFATLSAQTEDLPNIVFILADDMGIGDVGVYNQNERFELGLNAIATPNIDSLATNGMRFTNMHSCPMCSASRSSLQIGFHQGHGKVDRNVSKSNPIQPGRLEKTFAQMLQDNGYKTGLFGVWNLHGFHVGTGNIVDVHSTPLGKGYDRVWCDTIGSGYRSSHAIVDNNNLDGLIENSDLDLVLRPVSDDPNDSWAIENGGLGVAREYSVKTSTDKAIDFIDEQIESSNKFLAFVSLYGVHADTDEVPNSGSFGQLHVARQDQNYAASVDQVDIAVGRILQKLNDPNGDGSLDDSILDETMIVFASDNGNQSNSHNIAAFASTSLYDIQTESFLTLRGNKHSVFEGGTRGPFIVQWSGNQNIVPGSVYDPMATFCDWNPTIAEMLDVPKPMGVDGYSFWKDLIGGTSERPDFRLVTSASSFGSWALSMSDYKLVFDGLNSEFQLFHLPTNPEENSELQIVDRPEIVDLLFDLAEAEGATSDSSAISADGNDYFCQFKNWIGTNQDFHEETNWEGGTAFVRYDRGAPAINHLTGPASNWLVTIQNTSGEDKQIVVSQDTTILAAEMYGIVGNVTLTISSGITLEARNECRIGSNSFLVLDNSNLKTIRDVSVLPGGTLSGNGVIKSEMDLANSVAEFSGQGLLDAHVINDGILAPGLSTETGAATNQPIGAIEVEGRYSQTPTGTLQIELAGVQDSEFDHLNVDGDIGLAGVLEVRLIDNFQPEAGDTFNIVRAHSDGHLFGQFDELDIVGLPHNLEFEISYLEDAVSIAFFQSKPVLGDVDMNGVVNLLDVSPFIEVLQYSTYQFEADINGDGLVNNLDVAPFVQLLAELSGN